jgi:hypothetical protein
VVDTANDQMIQPCVVWKGLCGECPDILAVCVVFYVASDQIFLTVSVAVSAANGQLF